MAASAAISKPVYRRTTPNSALGFDIAHCASSHTSPGSNDCSEHSRADYFVVFSDIYNVCCVVSSFCSQHVCFRNCKFGYISIVFPRLCSPYSNYFPRLCSPDSNYFRRLCSPISNISSRLFRMQLFP